MHVQFRTVYTIALECIPRWRKFALSANASSLVRNGHENSCRAVFATFSAEDVTSRFDCVFWFGDLNSRIQKDRDQVETMLGVRVETNSPTQRVGFDDIVEHDELRRVINEG